MAEEHRCQAPEGHRLCANNCGFFGCAATMNLCSKCYGDYCLKQQQQQDASILRPYPPPSAVVLDSPAKLEVLQQSPALAVTEAKEEAVTVAVAIEQKQQPNRCYICRKRVGLTGFRCRCESMFCGTHRYPEKHDCTFDFKKIGREEIARANPLVLAEKLHKI
ncbi:zinc finger A20 and AN1 domain-containing stress-associated protein 4 [Mercurialis annua]|uniref:zinc finger A20 and AN1 domain-containing stress-associated protein 4 n=1 Tax=Mercurialis annua TaxID=3986 RepID=UPI00215FA0AB|nr:zinc finger A20 and AN1 domain-containing stress-associated protein 4 [Mercurialis annua]